MTLFMNTLALINFDLIKRTGAGDGAGDVVGVVVGARIRSLSRRQLDSTGLVSGCLLLLLSVLLPLLLLLVNLLTSRWRVAPFAVWRRSWQPEAAKWKSSKLSRAVPQKSSSLSRMLVLLLLLLLVLLSLCFGTLQVENPFCLFTWP